MVNQNNEKLNKRDQANQLVRLMLLGIPAIKFLGFQDFRIMDYTPSPNRFPEKWIEISTIPSLTYDEEVIAWIKTVLKSENLYGLYFLMFRDTEREADPSWAMVEFDQDYGWVDSIWLRGRMMEICNIDKNYSYMFIAEEGKWRAYKIEMLTTPRNWLEE